MLRARLILVLLFVIALTVASYLEPRFTAKAEAEQQSGGVLVLMLGDGRKMFANQLLAKADAYFHRGKYPSIFDQEAQLKENHMSSEAGHGGHGQTGHDDEHPASEEEGADSAGHADEDDGAESAPHDWIEAFGRRFYPTRHMHLANGGEREILPWLKLSVELDPHQIEVYAVTAYFLRDKIGNVREAEAFLRQGLRDNPQNPELLYQLSRCLEKEGEFTRANNLLQAALVSWKKTELIKEEPDRMLQRSILAELTVIAERNEWADQAVQYLEQLKEISPNPEQVQKRIDELRARQPVRH